MSISPVRSNKPSPPLAEPALERALHYWQQRLRNLPAGPDALSLLAHARQVLLLAARQKAHTQGLVPLLEALHRPMMDRGLIETWATDLQQLVQTRPELLQQAPQVGDALLTAWTAIGRWEQAQALVQRLRQAYGPRSGYKTAHLLYRQGNLAWMQGHWQQALRLARQAWRMAPREDVSLRVATAALLVLTHWRLQQPQQALSWGRRALALCPRDEHLWRGRLHHYLFLNALPHRPQHARYHRQQALAHLEAAGNSLHIAHIWADSTDLYLRLGQRSQAEEALNRAYALWRQSEDPAGLADYYRHAAIVNYALGRLRQARELAAYAAECWAALGVTTEVRRCQRLLQRWGPGPRSFYRDSL